MARQILRALADSGDESPATRLAGLLPDRGDLDELRALADAGDGFAARQPPGLLATAATSTPPRRSCTLWLMQEREHRATH